VTERGARPKVPTARRRLLHAARALTTPLLPDDYLELINPLWSTRELRGRIERIRHETPNAATVVIRPGWAWEGHRAGQYVRIGLDIDGVRHWRAYSLTSEPDQPGGCISITPKVVESGVVSPYLVRAAKPGTLVHLGGVEGEFVLPDPPPSRLLFITAGSGITPVMSMLRSLDRRGDAGDVVHLHSARTTDEVVFGAELRALAARHPRVRLHEQFTAEHGRIGPEDLDELCPDWRDRETFASGPGAMLDALHEHFERHGDARRLHSERFQPIIGSAGVSGDGGTIRFLKSGIETACDGGTPILVAGEEAGADLPYGCRMGICHTCVGRLRSGRVRDLRSGEVGGQEGNTVRTCVHAPEGPVEIEL
jgi:stearoyl-CoA 9-desaturase NADPH oxidoreductase